jgi:3',5'-cyclic AMP phosphodiesterase CpdA
MKIVAHLSDLRFGSEQSDALSILTADLIEARPALFVLSGDVTQNARPHQFEAVREFLNNFSAARLIVPGDRDQPRWNLPLRFVKPLHQFRSLLSADLRPWLANDELAILGINTTRPYHLEAGRISFDQLGHVRKRLLPLGAGRLKVLVTHHPILTPEETGQLNVDWTANSHQALAMVERAKLDLLLSGHAPASSSGSAHVYRLAEGHAVVAVQAGSPLQASKQNHQPSYNLIEVDLDNIVIKQRLRQGQSFVEGKVTHVTRTKDGWKKDS